MHSRKELSLKLKQNLPAASFLDSLKIAYRPYVCPFDELLTLLPEGKSIFDIGCGSGMFLMLAAEYSKPHKLGGIEISGNLVDNARSLLSSYKMTSQIEEYDGVKLPNLISEYDIVFLIDVFHHIPVPIQNSFFINLYKIMKPGSTFIFKDIDASKKGLVIMNKIHDLLLSGEIGNEVSSEEAQTLVKEAGFEVLSEKYIRTLWYPHYLIVCKK
jgi:cyclopropane fatty-acyl-phospholipid synthase-like methyltransferase